MFKFLKRIFRRDGLKDIQIEVTPQQKRKTIRVAITYLRDLQGVRRFIIFENELIRLTKDFKNPRSKLFNLGANIILSRVVDNDK